MLTRMGRLFGAGSNPSKNKAIHQRKHKKDGSRKPEIDNDQSGKYAFMGAPVGQLPPTTWLKQPELVILFEALAAGGREARLVGGCVRDALLGRAVSDIDIATPEPPERVETLLALAGIKTIPTGIEHGTITALINDKRFEITTLRIDVETDGRRANVVYTDDWEKDAARRDFTFNALSATLDGQVYDYYNGISDLSHGRVRFIGAAQERIDEDALRILRFFRFFAYLGYPPADRNALAAIRIKAKALQSLSAERIRAEMLKLLAAPAPVDALLLMLGERVLCEVLPESHDFDALRILIFLETRGLAHPNIAVDPLRRLAILLTSDSAAASALAKRWKMSRAEEKRLVAMVAPENKPDVVWDSYHIDKTLYYFSPDLLRDRLLIAWAKSRTEDCHIAPDKTRRWMEMLDRIEGWVRPIFPLSGNDVIALGIVPGPRIGALLREMEKWWVSNHFHPDRDQLLAQLAAVAENGDANSSEIVLPDADDALDDVHPQQVE